MSGEMDKIERLINRKLDGELTADEQLELDRTLIRSPEARRLFEALQRVDNACGGFVRWELAATQAVRTTVQPSLRFANARRKRAWRWAMPTALAACVAWIAWSLLSPLRSTVAPASDTPADRFVHAEPAKMIDAYSPRDGGLTVPEAGRDGEWARSHPGEFSKAPLRRVARSDLRNDRQRDTQYYGLVGDDGTVYLIEVDRTRTVQRAPAASNLRLCSGGF